MFFDWAQEGVAKMYNIFAHIYFDTYTLRINLLTVSMHGPNGFASCGAEGVAAVEGPIADGGD